MNQRGAGKTLDELARQLGRILQESPTARELAGQLAQRLQELLREAGWTETGAAGGGPLVSPSPEVSPASPPRPPVSVPPATTPGQSAEQGASESAMITSTMKLCIGDGQAMVEVKDTPEHILAVQRSMARSVARAADAPGEPEPEISLDLIATRCRLKAEGCRLAGQERAVQDGKRSSTDQQRKHQIDAVLRRAKALPNCFVWALFRRRPRPTPERLDILARCYEALAEAAELVQRWEGAGAIPELPEEREVLALMAEAHSMLRIALQEWTWLNERDGDRDQNDAHAWLKHRCALRQIYLEHHMRLDRAADPAAVDLVREKIAMTRTQIGEFEEWGRQVRRQICRIKHHARLLISGRDEEASHNWGKINEALKTLQSLGVPPTSVKIRRALDDAAQLDPPAAIRDRSKALDAAIKAALEADDAGSTDPDDDQPDPADVESDQNDAVARVRGWLAGKSIVVLGGVRRPYQIGRVERAFGVEARWMELREHGSGERLRAPIEHPDTVLVVILIRLAGHLHVDQARETARRCGKRCVNVPAGFGNNQIAQAILDQCSGYFENA
jgi:hypothetical protein